MDPAPTKLSSKSEPSVVVYYLCMARRGGVLPAAPASPRSHPPAGGAAAVNLPGAARRPRRARRRAVRPSRAAARCCCVASPSPLTPPLPTARVFPARPAGPADAAAVAGVHGPRGSRRLPRAGGRLPSHPRGAQAGACCDTRDRGATHSAGGRARAGSVASRPRFSRRSSRTPGPAAHAPPPPRTWPARRTRSC